MGARITYLRCAAFVAVVLLLIQAVGIAESKADEKLGLRRPKSPGINPSVGEALAPFASVWRIFQTISSC